MSYRRIDPDCIVETLAALGARVSDRFPEAGLAKVCAELTEIARESGSRATELARPVLWLRAVIAAVLVAGVAAMVGVASLIEYKREVQNLFGVLQGVDALLSVAILIGGAVFFLVTLEGRWKRQQALADLHELRAVIHVIDMHQLTKDPSAVLGGPSTPHSPLRRMTPFELTRYLDYCSEMLSLAAKLAALYAQSGRDPVVVDTANDLARLVANLNLKIWQKIALVRSEGVGAGG